MLASREDVIRSYQLVLNREPETEAVIDKRLAGSPSLWTVLGDLMQSNERLMLNARTYALSFEKCLKPKHLARSLSVRDGLRCYTHTLRHLTEWLSESSLAEMCYRHLEVTRYTAEDRTYRVTISYSRKETNEGELSLKMWEDGAVIYEIYFSFAPGHLFERDGDTILISKIQGVLGQYEAIRRASKAAKETDPQSYLFAVLHGLGLASGVAHLVGVSADNQVAFDSTNEATLVKRYDDFFRSVGMSGARAGFFAASIPIEHKPLSEIVGWHRKRSRAKRAFKAAVTETAAERWRALRAAV